MKVAVIGTGYVGLVTATCLADSGNDVVGIDKDAAKVRTLVGLAPSNHGTTLDGIVTLGADLNLLGFANSILWGVGVPGLAEQEVGSPFQTHLFAGGDTVAGPRYVVIETTHDEVVTPYTNAFLSGPNVTDIVLQHQCPTDPVVIQQGGLAGLQAEVLGDAPGGPGGDGI